MTEAAPGALDLPVTGMTCASCVRHVEQALREVPGVRSVDVNLALRRAHLTLDAGAQASTLVRAVVDAGYGTAGEASARLTTPHAAVLVSRAEALPGVLSARSSAEGLDLTWVRGATDAGALLRALKPLDPELRLPGEAPPAGVDVEAEEGADLARRLAVAVLFTVPIVVIAMGHGRIPGTSGPGAAWLQVLLSLPVFLWSGAGVFRSAWAAVRRRTADMNVLVALGALAALAASVGALLVGSGHHGPEIYVEASATILTFVLLGRWLELRARHHTGDAIRALGALRPDRALLLVEGDEVEIGIDEVGVGDLVVVRPGAAIPIDGVVTEGSAVVDEAMLTGEPLPLEKVTGSTVHAGTLAQGGRLVVRAVGVGADTALARIVAAVEEAQGGKAPIARTVDRIAAWFVPAVLVLAAATALGWGLLGPESDALSLALRTGIAVLVVACPCALGLATPTAILVGTGLAARHGILVRGGAALDALAQVDTVVFDKTGTLTVGRPTVHTVEGPPDLLATAAAVESGSEHPLGRAIVRAATERGAVIPLATALRSEAGAGVTAQVGGRNVQLGNAAALVAAGVTVPSLAPLPGTTVHVAIDGAWVGRLGLDDAVRKEAAAVLAALPQRKVLLTGDDAAGAAPIAAMLGLGEVIAGVRPEDKAQHVQALRAAGRTVLMVGDGINDAPALAAADVGLAMGGGTDAARAAADVRLLREDLLGVVDALSIGRATRTTIRLNLLWAFGYNVVMIPLAMGLLRPLTGWMLSPMAASAAMSLSSVSVVLSSLALRVWWRPAPSTP